ncbi:alpha/beta hydrolase [Belnapia rosea]|uniref:Acetyl esterase/lipase n=1 Tax=Belnapia rosea TaxID=938405 RepID=A0A1G6L7S7_9PROT|nr:alpha/beta hydrolase [Belnapia rosea]SDC39251.1 Acetyl esterase/lipase [Belnapia rosea]
MAYDPLPPFWAGASLAERSAAYDNSTAVADSPALIAARNAEAAPFRAARAGHLDLAYGPTQRTAWDLFPAAEASAPCLVFIHGGYWQRNRREDFCAFMAGALERGWSAALPGYSLGPEATLTQIVGEIRAALDWLQAHGAEHGIGGKVVLSGWSAGGHLTAMALDHPVVTAGLAISGIFELAPIRDTDLNEKLALTEAELAALSPMRLPVVQKPLAIAYGTGELPELRRQSRDFHALRAEAHAPGPLIPVSGADHFRILEALKAKDGEMLRAAEDLLRFG